MKHQTYLLVAVALLLSVAAIGCAKQHAQATPIPEHQTCDKAYDFQCLQKYRLCQTSFVTLRGWGTECAGTMPIEECVVSAGYDQQIYTSFDTSTRVKYYTQAQLDACKR
jgi:hypothetical protein